MFRQPDIYKAAAIKIWDCDKRLPNGTWVPARPLGHNAWSWRIRWKLAFMVLIGKADALFWD